MLIDARQLTGVTLSAITLLALLPLNAQAGHRIDSYRLHPTVCRMHEAFLHFERMAHRRPMPRHELKYIQLMSKQASDLREAVERRRPEGVIRARYNVLKAFTNVVDRRLENRCRHHHDRRLTASWESALHEFHTVGCHVNGCGRNCHIHGPRHGHGHSQRHHGWTSRYRPLDGITVFGF